MTNDTIIMSGSLICLLLLNTFVFLYNQEPIETNTFDIVDVSVTQFETGINESGIEQSSSGLKIVFNIISFFFNIVILLFGWYTSFPFVINLIIKFTTYLFTIPFFITLIHLIRGN